MVDRIIIENIIDNILSNITIKCHPTIEEMKNTLSNMSYRDMMKELHEKDLFKTIFEWRYFSDLIEYYERHINDENYKDDIKEVEDEFFLMGRRLIEGLPPQNEPIDINKDNYNEDNQFTGFWDKESDLSTKVGSIEQKQIDAQKNIFNKSSDITVTDDTWGVHTEFESNTDERVSMNEYFAGDSSHLNRDIYNKKYLKELDAQQQSRMKNIDKLMDKSPGLQQDTILYRTGTFDVHLRVGDHGKWKGYTSTSFQRASADEYGGGRFDVTYVIHAPKGTKGIVGNDRSNFKNGFLEHEFALARNTGYTILSFDPDNRVCEIVLDEV